MRLALVTKAEWGSKPTTVAQLLGAQPEVYVHHVAGRTPTSLVDERKHMRELQDYALSGKGGRYPVGTYSDLDYSILIGPSGTPYEGRGYFGRPAATLDRNHCSRAICFMGNTDTREPTRAQLETLPELIVEMVRVGSLRRDVNVLGHFQNPAHPNATSCPGRFMTPHLPAVRAEVSRLLAPPPPTEETPDMKYLRVYVPGDATRAEALVLLEMKGFSTPSERDAVGRVLDTEDRPVTAAQYDALLSVFKA